MRFADPRPQISTVRNSYTYYPGTQVVPENAAVKVLNTAHAITADVELAAGDEGVVFSHGSNVGGYTLFVADGKLHYVHNYVGAQELHVASEQVIDTGRHTLRYEFEPSGAPDVRNGKGTPGRGRLLIDGTVVGEAQFAVTIPLAIGIGGGAVVGRNPGSPITDRYTPPYAFTGTIHQVTVSTATAESHDEDEAKRAEARVAMARQ